MALLGEGKLVGNVSYIIISYKKSYTTIDYLSSTGVSIRVGRALVKESSLATWQAVKGLYFVIMTLFSIKTSYNYF